MDIIKKITKKQLHKMPQYTEKWVKIMASTDSNDDIEGAYQALTKLYARFGVAKPEYTSGYLDALIVELKDTGPLYGRHGLDFTSFTKSTIHHVHGHISEFVLDQISRGPCGIHDSVNMTVRSLCDAYYEALDDDDEALAHDNNFITVYLRGFFNNFPALAVCDFILHEMSQELEREIGCARVEEYRKDMGLIIDSVKVCGGFFPYTDRCFLLRSPVRCQLNDDFVIRNLYDASDDGGRLPAIDWGIDIKLWTDSRGGLFSSQRITPGNTK